MMNISFQMRMFCTRNGIWRKNGFRHFSTKSPSNDDISTEINSLLFLPSSLQERMDVVEMEERGDHDRLHFAIPSYTLKKPRETVLKSWGHYFANRGFDGPPSLAYHNKRLITMLTAAYTGPITILKGLEILNADHVNSTEGKRRLEIHVVGAASQEETLLLTYWTEIGALLPHCSIRIRLIGPELSARAIIDPNVTLSTNLAATLHQCSYDEFLINKKVRSSAPDLVVMLNPGIGTDFQPWERSLSQLLELRSQSSRPVPILCTAFDEQDQERDLAALQRVGFPEETQIKPADNPFASFLLERSQNDSGRIIRCNARWMAF
uniref:Mitochondrial splicing suppressor 51-like C-terminal domain-containing protein n=1 Tax=Hanusia phi TaxID=3032 RepID=A0A7S0EKJ4_9CRYP|mmetsp:Transcript_25632/g.57621  ORF Transcript_25632/g.57621 Transcript_25632/m.57621 type:complete len:322 (+) Transcript_25632:127-1092(+)